MLVHVEDKMFPNYEKEYENIFGEYGILRKWVEEMKHAIFSYYTDDKKSWELAARNVIQKPSKKRDASTFLWFFVEVCSSYKQMLLFS